ncbi:hypothetical protein C8R43DRAFT_957850 [Mycena crocata]|nr:hypothetical protein C8R43DRAFT_957850 [Mycena crocata]
MCRVACSFLVHLEDLFHAFGGVYSLGWIGLNAAASERGLWAYQRLKSERESCITKKRGKIAILSEYRAGKLQHGVRSIFRNRRRHHRPTLAIRMAWYDESAGISPLLGKVIRHEQETDTRHRREQLPPCRNDTHPDWLLAQRVVTRSGSTLHVSRNGLGVADDLYKPWHERIGTRQERSGQWQRFGVKGNGAFTSGVGWFCIVLQCREKKAAQLEICDVGASVSMT